LAITTMQNDNQAINQHYGRGDLGAAILAALEAAGKDLERLSPDDLALVDQFHLGGKQATLELVHLAGLQAGMEVLDVGGGLGGPARLLAVEQACRVTVLDVTEEYCRVGSMLTARTGLLDRVSFQQGSALEMPFPDARFDAVWTLHSSMNIADKARLYAEISRVLRPAGRLALYEIMVGPVQPLHFPVPWAADQTISFLLPPEAVRALLVETGFKEVAWVEMSARLAALSRERPAPQASAAPALPALGEHLLLGAQFDEIVRNARRNLEEQRIAVIQAVFERI
jgi:SAM-dependent methyltransferase